MALVDIPQRIRFFIHPVPLAAVFIMALNDHWLKYQFPGLITGKLSDFCGVFYLPIFLLALAETGDELLKSNRFRLGAIGTLVAIGFTDILMLVVKLSAKSSQFIEIFFENFLFPIQLVQDPTDLLALLVNPLTYIFLRRYWTTSKETWQR